MDVRQALKIAIMLTQQGQVDNTVAYVETLGQLETTTNQLAEANRTVAELQAKLAAFETGKVIPLGPSIPTVPGDEDNGPNRQ